MFKNNTKQKKQLMEGRGNILSNVLTHRTGQARQPC